MKVTVRFLDGEELEGDSEAVKPEELGFPVTVLEGNNRTVWVSMGAIKYVVFNTPSQTSEGAIDPRANRNLDKVVLHFVDGDVVRTYKDERFIQEGETFNLQVWDPKRRALTRMLVSKHALKGVFFVKAWDSRDQKDKDEHATRRSGQVAPAAATTWLTDDEYNDIDPEMRRLARSYQRRLALERDLEITTDPVIFERAIRQRLERLLDEDMVALKPQQKEQLATVIIREAVGYGPLDPLLKDPSVTEIMVNSPSEVYVERNGRLLRTQVRFDDAGQLLNVMRRIAASVGRRIDESSPMVDARLPDGSRLNAVIPPAATRGPALTIRKFKSSLMTLDDLLAQGTASPAIAAFLQAAVLGRLNMLISGGTGTGKTTTLNVLGALIPARERVVTIEDSAELQLSHANLVALEYRPPNVEGTGELTIRSLLRNSLRMRPDRVMVGEVRDSAALDMLQAMNTGHDGSMSTIHANSARDAFSRLETMVLSGTVELPLPAVRAQIASAINVVIHQSRLPDGTRKITQVSELSGYEGERPVLQDIFLLTKDDEGYRFEATGAIPHALVSKLAFYGVELPEELFYSAPFPVALEVEPAAPAAGPPEGDEAAPVETEALAEPAEAVEEAVEAAPPPLEAVDTWPWPLAPEGEVSEPEADEEMYVAPDEPAAAPEPALVEQATPAAVAAPPPPPQPLEEADRGGVPKPATPGALQQRIAARRSAPGPANNRLSLRSRIAQALGAGGDETPAP